MYDTIEHFGVSDSGINFSGFWLDKNNFRPIETIVASRETEVDNREGSISVLEEMIDMKVS